MLLPRLALAILPFVGLVASQLACGTLPVWNITDVKIVTKDTVGSSGTLTLNIADSLTGKSDALKCSLVANYRCTIKGIPSDKNAVIELQSQMDVLYVSIITTLGCGKVAGNADLEMVCKTVARGDITCTVDKGEVKAGLLA